LDSGIVGCVGLFIYCSHADAGFATVYADA
jgi:hypothetical protein